jgi:protein arginine N-methyltransferase 1
MSMYTIHDYGRMNADRDRTWAYAQALTACMTPESVVLDVGAGAGTLTLLACRAGARKVYAVEPEGIIELARELVATNGYADRVVFVQALSTNVTLSEPVDLLVSDLRGALPFFQSSVTAIVDARERLLKPGGALIPRRDVLMASLVNAPRLHRSLVGPWDDCFGFDCSAARHRAVNRWMKTSVSPELLIADPQPVMTLDYHTQTGPNGRGSASWTIEAAHEAHGFCLWFDCETAGGAGFSNAPGASQAPVYEQSYFPWPDVRRLEPGDEVTVEIRADLVGEDYIWSWNTDIRGRQSTTKTEEFRQSLFRSADVSTDWLRKTGASFVPRPNDDAAIDRMILDLLFAGISIEHIARRVSDAFPQRFPDWQKALTRVGDMSLRYSE